MGKMFIAICVNKKCNDFDDRDRRNCPKYGSELAIKCKKHILKEN